MLVAVSRINIQISTESSHKFIIAYYKTKSSTDIQLGTIINVLLISAIIMIPQLHFLKINNDLIPINMDFGIFCSGSRKRGP